MSNVSPPQSPASQATSHSSAQGRAGAAPAQGQRAPGDTRTQQEIDSDNKLADRLSQIIEGANEQLIPICERVRKCIDNMFAQKEEDRDEEELVKQVKPLLEQAEKTLNQTNGAIHGMDPEKSLTNRVKRNAQDHSASPSEQRLAEALKVMLENVQGTIDWAKDKLDSFPKATKDLGPLLDAMGQPIMQIVGGVGLLLAGVLNLLGNLLRGLGLDSLLKGIVGAIGLDKIYKGLGLDKWLQYGGK